jgi:choline kinase
MKVSFEGGYLARISKALAQVQTQGENVGILKFDGEGTQALFSKADELVRTAGGENLWAPSALDEIVKDMPVRGVDVAGIPWTEIDFAEDLAYARQEIWPAILNDFEVRIPVSETHPRASIPVE